MLKKVLEPNFFLRSWGYQDDWWKPQLRRKKLLVP